MKARHINYGFAALVLSGQPVLTWLAYVFGEDGHGQPSVGSWLLSSGGLWAFSFVVSAFATGYLVSRYGSTRAVRIAGLAAMPLGTCFFFLGGARLVALSLPDVFPHQTYGYLLALTYPMFAAVLCWLAALATRAPRTWHGDAAEV